MNKLFTYLYINELFQGTVSGGFILRVMCDIFVQTVL